MLHLPSHQQTWKWNQGLPKRKVVFQPPPVSFHVGLREKRVGLRETAVSRKKRPRGGPKCDALSRSQPHHPSFQETMAWCTGFFCQPSLLEKKLGAPMEGFISWPVWRNKEIYVQPIAQSCFGRLYINGSSPSNKIEKGKQPLAAWVFRVPQNVSHFGASEVRSKGPWFSDHGVDQYSFGPNMTMGNIFHVVQVLCSGGFPIIIIAPCLPDRFTNHVS